MYTPITQNNRSRFLHIFLITLFTFLISLNSLAYADMPADPATPSAVSAPAQNTAETPFQFIFQTVQFFLFGFFIYYMLVLRPQQLNEETQARFLKDLKKDDDVETSGGILGKVVAIAEDFITVEVASGVKLKVLKPHIKATKQKVIAVKK